MASFVTLLKKDLLEIKRSKKLLIFILIFTFLVAVSVATAKVMPLLYELLLEETGIGFIGGIDPTVADSYVQLAANIGELGILLVMILFVPSMQKEKISGTYYMLKTQNVSEWKIMLSHFLSKLILLTIAYVISIGVFVGLNLLVFKSYAGVRGMVALIFLYLLLVFTLALSLLISSICKKRSSAYLLSIGLYFILFILASLPYIDVYNPFYAITLASKIVTQVDYDIVDYIRNFAIISSCTISFIILGTVIFKNKVNNRK